jgi:DnaJ-class molecular chaperone
LHFSLILRNTLFSHNLSTFNQNWGKYEDTIRQKGLSASFHYDNLQLQPGHAITRKRLKQQFQKLAFHWHPDRNQEPEAKERFRQIHESFRLLDDPVQRRDYDQWLQHSTAFPAATGPINDTDVANKRNYGFSDSQQFARDRERFYDHRAAQFARQRQQFTNNSQQQHPSGGYYSSASGWAEHHSERAKQNAQQEFERIQLRRSIMAESQFKFALIFLVMTSVIVFNVRKDKEGDNK